MKINTIRTLPEKLGIAFSGGIDSSVLLDISIKLNREVILVTFDHGDVTSEKEIAFAKETSEKFDIPLIVGSTTSKLCSGQSKESFWSVSRNTWFNSLEMPVATGHHLNDVAEWYMMTALTGNGGYYMDYSNKNVIRPLITTKRCIIEKYAEIHSVNYIIDNTNFDVDFNKRNRVRLELMPVVCNINSGFLNTMKRNIIRKEFG